MARLPFRSFPKAVEFNIETLFNLEGQTGFFCISPSTWELAYSLILGYGYWRSRYYFRDPTTGELQDITDDEFTEITNIVDIAIEEFQMAGCDDLVVAVDNLTAQVGLINIAAPSAGCECGAPAYGGILPDGATEPGGPGSPPPDGFDSWPIYYAYKCAAANRIVDDYIATLLNISKLVLSFGPGVLNPNIVSFLSIQLSQFATVGLIRLGYNTSLSAALVIDALVALYLEDPGYYNRIIELADELEADKETGVCILFEASDTPTAKTALRAWQNSFYLGLTYTGGQLESFFGPLLDRVFNNLVNNTVLNLLFEYHAETDGYGGDIDCADCDPLGCTDFYSFDDNSTGWGFEDISANGGAAQGAWDEAAGALRVDMQTDGSANSLGRGRWTHGLGTQIPYGIGATITMRYPASEDAEVIGYDVWVTYTDASQENNNVEDADAGELTLTLAENKTVQSFAVGIGRSNGAGGGTAYDLSGYCLDVCVTLP
jgi:hypothetical protein